ncbi:MAG: hypothetical protein M3441_23660 [Chloroflexota bacterium]|nr:hypothetical protein [Chloroflexota bacterium]
MAFGLGVSFLLFGLPTMRRASPNSRLMVWAMYLSIGWLLVSWLPHRHLHQVVGENLQELLYIEYGIHVTTIIGAAVLAYGFVSLLRQQSKPTPRVE